MMKKDISANLYQKCLILCSNAVLNVLHNTSSTRSFYMGVPTGILLHFRQNSAKIMTDHQMKKLSGYITQGRKNSK